MPRLESERELTCPCCGAALVVDVNLGRIVSHEPQLPNGDYRLEVDVDVEPDPGDSGPSGRSDRNASENEASPSNEGRRAIQRQVTLGGGSTQVDLSTALGRRDR